MFLQLQVPDQDGPLLLLVSLPIPCVQKLPARGILYMLYRPMVLTRFQQYINLQMEAQTGSQQQPNPEVVPGPADKDGMHWQ
jgi:hypothetical protein